MGTRSGEADCVVLVHGLWMNGAVFGLMRRRLERKGFMVRTYSYPTIRAGLDENATGLRRFVSGIRAGRIHLVGHSLGGLIVLAMLAADPDPRIARVVLMGVPCNGSWSASMMGRFPMLRRLLGQSLHDWTERAPVLPDHVEVGVIAGTGGIGLGRLFPGLPTPNDGVVALAETRLAGARDAISIRTGHSTMLFSRRCVELVLGFLEKGRFGSR